MSKSGGVFQIDDVTRTMSKGGGCAWCSTHPSSDPPPPPGWLATGLYRLLFRFNGCLHERRSVRRNVQSSVTKSVPGRMNLQYRPVSLWLPPTCGCHQPVAAWLPPTCGCHQPVAAWLPPTRGCHAPTCGCVAATNLWLRGCHQPVAAWLPPTCGCVAVTNLWLPPTCGCHQLSGLLLREVSWVRNLWTPMDDDPRSMLSYTLMENNL